MTRLEKAQGSPGQPALVWAALLTVYLLWGSTYLAIRVAVATMPPLLMAGARFTIAGAILCAWRLPAALAAGRPPTPAQWRRATIIGALLLLGGNGGLSFAEQWLPSGLSALLVSTVPIWMALIDWLLFRRRVRPVTIAGLALGLAGVGVLVGTPSTSGSTALAIATVLGGSIAWAGGTLYSRGARLPDDLLLGTGMQMICGGGLLLLVALVTGEFRALHVAAVAPAAWLGFAYLVFLGGVVGFSAYLWLVRNAPTPLVSTYAYVNPFVAVVLGGAILHEPVDWHTVAGGAIILMGVACIASASGRR